MPPSHIDISSQASLLQKFFPQSITRFHCTFNLVKLEYEMYFVQGAKLFLLLFAILATFVQNV